MPGRKYSATNSYRYGFNGKENDNEAYGQGNQYDYGFRIYNPRLGRFLSVDPLTKKYPFYTPYQFAGNKPIKFIDMDGLEEKDPQRQNSGVFSDAPDNKYNTGAITRPPPSHKDRVTQFGIGILKTLFYTFAAVTEEAGSMHYGDKIKKEDYAQQFPLVPNNNIAKDIIIPSLTWPVQLVNDLKRDPTNAQLWGQAFGAILLGKLSSEAPGFVKNALSNAKARVSLATKFFDKEGIPLNQTSGIDFSSPVYKVRLEAGTEVIQWRQPGQNPTGAWFTLPGEDPATLGLPSEYSVGYRIKLTTSVEVLKSTAGDIENFMKPTGNGEILKGGGLQYSSGKIKVGENAEIKGTINRPHK